jgi:hypothetical protein|tara:strand:- start:296 stop:403 length:108 start_codon:yes stop_codon:yes gene_type:complete
MPLSLWLRKMPETPSMMAGMRPTSTSSLRFMTAMK